MNWAKAALALMSVVQLILEMANARRLKGEGAAEAIAAAAKDALDDLSKAREARLRARTRDRNGGLHDDQDIFRRD